ncbi:unnamed protein product [Parajaminaea phylloscopi]
MQGQRSIAANGPRRVQRRGEDLSEQSWLAGAVPSGHAIATAQERAGVAQNGSKSSLLRADYAPLQSSSSGHGEDSSSNSVEDTVLGHGTMASLLNPTFSSRPAPDQGHRGTATDDKNLHPSSPKAHSPRLHHREESDSSLSFDSLRQSFDSNTSNSSQFSPRSLSSSPSASTISARKRSGSRASTASSLARPLSPYHPPPNEPLPALPGSTYRPARRSNTSLASSSISMVSNGSSRTDPRSPPPSEPLPALPGRSGPWSPASTQQASASRGSISTIDALTDGEMAAGQGARQTTSSGHNAATPARYSTEKEGQPTPHYTHAPLRHEKPGSAQRHPSGSESSNRRNVAHDFPAAGQAVPDRVSSLAASSSTNDVATPFAHEPHRGSLSSLDSRNAPAGGSNAGMRNSNTSFVALYEGSPDSLAHDDARTATGEPSASELEEDLSNATPTRTPRMLAADQSTSFNAPIISIDHVDSDASDIDADSSVTTPRKKQRQRPRVSPEYGFDYQRVSAPHLRSAKSGQASASVPAPAPASKQADTQGPDPFAFYSFCPELPPFVPQGLRPIDLTGRGTWQSIMARAGSVSPAISRANSVSTLRDAGTDVGYEVGQTTAPTSMRQIAAETRAKQAWAKEYAEKQADLLSKRSWEPAEIHAIAAEQGANDVARSEHGSVISPDFTGSHASFNSLAVAHDTTGMAYDFTRLANLHRAASFASQVSLQSRTSEAGVGDDVVSSLGLGIGRANSTASKEYREFSQQTTPPASPEPTVEGLADSAKDVGVGSEESSGPAERLEAHLQSTGGVGSDTRHVETKSATLAAPEAWSSADEDDEGRVPSGPSRLLITQGKQARRRRATSELAASTPHRSLKNSIPVEESLKPFKIYTPRLSSRRSNIGTSPYKCSVPARNSTLSLDDGSRSYAAKLRTTSSDTSDAESDDSGESDLDLATPARELADRTGAFDAVVQARGSKRKLTRNSTSTGMLVSPGSARVIAGSERVRHSIVRPPPSASGSNRSPLKAHAGKVAAQRQSVTLSAPGLARGVHRIAPATAEVPGRSGEYVSDASARPDSPDLHTSFTGGMDSDSEDGEESLMLSEMEFPEPATPRRPVARLSDPHSSVTGKPSVAHRQIKPVDLASPIDATKSPAAGTTNDLAGNYTEPRTPDPSDIADTPNTCLGSPLWSTLADSHRASASTATTAWSRDSTGSRISVDEEKEARATTEKLTGVAELQLLKELSLLPANGSSVTDRVDSVGPNADIPSAASGDGVPAHRPLVPSPRVSFAVTNQAVPGLDKRKAAGRTSLPVPAASRSGILKPPAPVRRPSEPLPPVSVSQTRRGPTVGAPARVPSKAPPVSRLPAPTLRKAASFASHPTRFEVPASIVSRPGAMSPPLSRYSAASPSMAVPADSTRGSRPPSRTATASPNPRRGSVEPLTPKLIKKPSNIAIGVKSNLNSPRGATQLPKPHARISQNGARLAPGVSATPSSR